MNIIVDTDSYKASHSYQLPPGTESLFSYISTRGGHYEKCLFYAALPLLLERLSTCITPSMVEEAQELITSHGEPFPYDGWMYVARELGGRIPLHVRALPEGTVVPVGMPVMTVRSTDPHVPWMNSWMETPTMRIWYPSTVATRSWHIKGIIYDYLVKTAEDPDTEIMFKLHDFGSRGVSSRESAGIGGSAHLVNFMGTDTMQALQFIRKYYGEKMAGFSIPASEHSTITSWGRDNERAAMENMVNQFGKRGSILACVSDSYNIYKAVEDIWCSPSMQDSIKSKGCTVVIRPDSGHPATVVNRVLDILDKKIGMTRNSKGFKVLPGHMRIIQGDGIDESSIQEILSTMAMNGYSASNIAFGMGGALLQKLDRDTMSWAMKCSAIKINGKWQDVWKDPVDDRGKASLRGLVDTKFIIDDKYAIGTQGFIESDEGGDVFPSAMEDVYYSNSDAELFIKTDHNFTAIRERAATAHLARFVQPKAA